MSIFLWGDDPTLKWPHLKQAVRVLSTESTAKRSVQHSALGRDDAGNPTFHVWSETVDEEVPDPTEWVQVSRRFRGVRNIKTGEDRDLGREAFELFRQRGGGTEIGLDYRLKPIEYRLKQGKSDRELMIGAVKEGWALGYEGLPITRDFVWAPVGIWAHIGALFRFLGAEAGSPISREKEGA